MRELISSDASLRVADAFAERLAESPYFGNYDRWSMPWKLALGEVDSERAVIILRRDMDTDDGGKTWETNWINKYRRVEEQRTDSR